MISHLTDCVIPAHNQQISTIYTSNSVTTDQKTAVIKAGRNFSLSLPITQKAKRHTVVNMTLNL
jgi:hypothetical protein